MALCGGIPLVNATKLQNVIVAQWPNIDMRLEQNQHGVVERAYALNCIGTCAPMHRMCDKCSCKKDALYRKEQRKTKKQQELLVQQVAIQQLLPPPPTPPTPSTWAGEKVLTV